MSNKKSSGFIIDGLNLPSWITGSQKPTKDQKQDADDFMEYQPSTLVEKLCAKIQRRAMRSKAAIFHIYQHGHTNSLTVIARSRDHNYMAKAETWPAPLLERYVPLDAPDTVEQLAAVLDEMKALGRKKV